MLLFRNKGTILKSETTIYDVMILGAGAAGMMCAAQLNAMGNLNVLVVEGNERAAKKLKISGGGKCNITNIHVNASNYLGDEQLIDNVLMQFSKDDLLVWLETRGLIPIIRKAKYYFCAKSSDEIINTLVEASQKSDYVYNQKITSLTKSDHFTLHTATQLFKAKHVVVATGAKSFASLGASEIGLRLAESFGHKVTPFSPALAGLTLQANEFWMKELSGISFPVSIEVGGKVLLEEMLLTHRGLSGPVILSASLYWSRGEISVNFLPELELTKFMANNRKLLSTALPLPKRFTQRLLKVLNIKDKPCHSYQQEELQKIQKAFQAYSFSPAGSYGFAQAEVCKGGVDTTMLNSWTLESHLKEDLYFCGELVDVTGELGGYNFQWAFSSGVSVANAICG